MPAMLDDPESPTIHRVSGALPYPDPNNPALPTDVRPRQVTLRDRQTVATIVPFVSKDQVPPTLLKYLSDQLAKEIEGGDTYPMIDPMPCEKFSSYWFQNFAAIMLLGDISSPEDVIEGKDWSKECLGSFYIKPNYPGRSSHVCNAGFLVTDASRNRGAGRLMGESYIDWAPKLGYSYSVFNLVYETNVASCKIWDALGFKRIGRVKGCGRLKSYPDRLVDAIIYGRDLVGDDAEGPVSEDRFDKIKFYLKHGRYPDGSNRADKSRLRSAATHYKLLDNDVLMLKGKEVISDPVRQMDIAKRLHEGGSHSGINKTTATIAERYHWSRIKETVSDVIRLCPECKESSKVSGASTSSVLDRRSVPGANLDDLNMTPDSVGFSPLSTPNEAAVGMGTIEHHHSMTPLHHANANPYANPGDIASLLNPVHPLEAHDNSVLQSHSPMLQDQTHDHMTQVHRAAQAASVLIGLHDDAHALYQPIDPQIISQAPHQHNQHHHFPTFDPPHIIPSHHSPHVAHSSLSDGSYDPHLQVHHTHHQEETESFQALLDDPDPLGSGGGHHDDGGGNMQVHPNANDQEEQDQAAVDRDLDMLLDPDSDSDDIDDLGFCSPGGGGGSGTGKHASPSPGAEKRDRHDAVETDRSAKRRNWDSVVFDDDP
ncbi:acetyltransferase [Apiospora arundinis]|uniref:Acetyltransferase n=1 Tax=Apiospora arundinis TaxID=335852 RepID=A0ABR2JBD7_9PEZI